MNNHIVYFVQAPNGLIKIGRTSNMPKRMKSLNSMSPVLISLFHVITCDNSFHSRDLENKFHEKFKSKNHHGEWFKLSKADIKSIKKYDRNEEIDLPYQELKNYSIICPECGKSVKGKRGLLSHENFCPGEV